MKALRHLALLASVVVTLASADAAAQPLGTFRWQLLPYCNIVTLVVVRNADVFSLDGYDDQCGAATRAPVTGLATQNPDGSIELGFTVVVTPTAASVHVAATISLATLSGTWRDSTGATGAFVTIAVTGTGMAGTPRPAPVDLTVSTLNVVEGADVTGPLKADSVSARGAGSFATLATTGATVIGGNVTAAGAASFQSLTVANEVGIGGNVNARSLFSNSGHIGITSFNNVVDAAPVLEFTRGRGTGNVPPSAGDRMAQIDFSGVVNGVGGRRPGASIRVNATQIWGNSSAGASLTFSTNPNSAEEILPRMIIDHNGEVGIGTLTPDALLSVNGTASKIGGGSWSVFSDERLKTVHGTFSRGLDALTQLEPIRYAYRPDNPLGLHAGAEYVGFSAQAVQRAIPEAVSTADNGYLRLDADPILWTMLNAVKELKRQNDALVRRLAALEAALAARP